MEQESERKAEIANNVVGVSIVCDIEGGPKNVRIGENWLFDIDPVVAALGMKCIATWAIAESLRIGMVTTIASSDRRTVVKSLHKRRSAQYSRDTLKELCKANLSEEEKALFFSVADCLYRVEQRRNDLAHGLWAYPRDEPSTLVVLNPNVLESIQLAAAALADGCVPEIPRLEENQILELHTRDTLSDLFSKIRFACKAVVLFTHWIEKRNRGRVEDQARLHEDLSLLLRASAENHPARKPRAGGARG